MSPLPTNVDEQVVRMFPEVCSASLCQVLGQVSGEQFTSAVIDLVPPPERGEQDGVWARCICSGTLTGEIGFFISKQDALRLSVSLTGEPADESVELPGTLRIALAGLFRRFAGEASTALRARSKQEVELSFQDLAPIASPAALEFSFQLQGAKTSSLAISAVADEAFAKSMAAWISTAPDGERRSTLGGKAQKEDNIGLLLDIQLEATLRFGEREMLLGEILKLNPGSVVELNRRINEPVELLVCGKVIAKGDVVVTDGNYGLRVTQIVSAADRMSSIRL